VARVRERGEREIYARLPRAPLLLLCPTAKDKGNQRERGGVRVAGLWSCSWSVLQREKEERRKKEEGIGGLAEFHLNFE
jgi:hypothetical protein